MNAVVMDDAVVGEESIVGALCFVPSEMKIPPRKVVVGNPAKIIKNASDEMIKWKTEGTKLYQQLARDHRESLKPCEPLRKIPAGREKMKMGYEAWHKIKDDE
jgi:carbonic anhydrase/acetyltransferase-like protein (isoleucine patch superfamily)